MTWGISRIGIKKILIFTFVLVNWKQMTTSSVCFGASADSFGQFVVPITGDVITFRLTYQHGSIECASGLQSHWGCSHPSVPQDRQLGTLITNNRSERLLPQNDIFPAGASTICNYCYYGLRGQTIDSPELLFDNFSTPLHVLAGEKFGIWFGEDLYKRGHTDNGQNKTCVKVFGLFV